MRTYRWTPEHEAAYYEERKYKCEHCHPDHDDTVKWMESVCNQDLLFAVHNKYGITPHTVYREFETEISVHEERMIIHLSEEVA